MADSFGDHKITQVTARLIKPIIDVAFDALLIVAIGLTLELCGAAVFRLFEGIHPDVSASLIGWFPFLAHWAELRFVSEADQLLWIFVSIKFKNILFDYMGDHHIDLPYVLSTSIIVLTFDTVFQIWERDSIHLALAIVLLIVFFMFYFLSKLKRFNRGGAVDEVAGNIVSATSHTVQKKK